MSKAERDMTKADIAEVRKQLFDLQSRAAPLVARLHQNHPQKLVSTKSATFRKDRWQCADAEFVRPSSSMADARFEEYNKWKNEAAARPSGILRISPIVPEVSQMPSSGSARKLDMALMERKIRHIESSCRVVRFADNPTEIYLPSSTACGMETHSASYDETPLPPLPPPNHCAFLPMTEEQYNVSDTVEPVIMRRGVIHTSYSPVSKAVVNDNDSSSSTNTTTRIIRKSTSVANTSNSLSTVVRWIVIRGLSVHFDKIPSLGRHLVYVQMVVNNKKLNTTQQRPQPDGDDAAGGNKMIARWEETFTFAVDHSSVPLTLSACLKKTRSLFKNEVIGIHQVVTIRPDASWETPRACDIQIGIGIIHTQINTIL
jgi:hypothetical protein